ncbi:MAG: TM0106 family RecB-like putative nuclease [Thermosynechococcaceae cyanobacterium]
MLLTARQLLSFQRCQRQTYLDTFGDLQQKADPSDFLTKLRQDRAQHQQEFLANYTWEKPSYPPRDWSAGAQATLDLMQRGVEQIHRGILKVTTEPDLTLVAIPDLLTKVPGDSFLGDWQYVPTSIQLSKRPKLEYQLLATFQALVLADCQGAWPETAYLYLRERGWYTVDLEKNRPKLAALMTDLIALLREGTEPEAFIVNNRCSLCGWYDSCYTTAKSQQHLSLIPGITPSRYPMLQAHNLNTAEDIAALTPASLQALTGFGKEVATKMVHQAQAFVHHQPIAIATHPPGYEPLLPTAPVELYFDIEAEPSLNLAYLHGVLVINHETQDQTFYPLLAEAPEGEQQVWEQFLDLVQRYPDAPIFHFCAYEVQTVERLARLYNTPMPLIESLLERFVDLHIWVTKTAVLPIESYTLKLIARWIGFEWRNSEANGAQSIYWYSQWLETCDRTFLDTIVHYNEDDCRATYYVRDWLTQFLAQQPIPPSAQPLEPALAILDSSDP